MMLYLDPVSPEVVRVGMDEVVLDVDVGNKVVFLEAKVKLINSH